MIIIPLQAIPAQTFNITLNGQACTLAIYQKGSYFFMDLAMNGVPVRQGRMLLNGVWFVRYAYFGFIGDIVMFDTQGTDEIPAYAGLGTRYQLYYLTPAEIAAKAAA